VYVTVLKPAPAAPLGVKVNVPSYELAASKDTNAGPS
jgi:hypothetical protein